MRAADLSGFVPEGVPTVMGGPSWTVCKRGGAAPRLIRSDRLRASQEMQVAEPLAVVGRADIEPRPRDGAAQFDEIEDRRLHRLVVELFRVQEHYPGGAAPRQCVHGVVVLPHITGN